MSDWNAGIVKEFRENDGVVGGMFEGWPMLILHHTGAKSGVERETPLTYQPLDGGYAIFASKGGAPTNPDWYHNLLANPAAAVEVGTERVAVTARVAEGDERHTIWERQKAGYPNFADYEQKTTRTIPVIDLEPSS